MYPGRAGLVRPLPPPRSVTARVVAGVFFFAYCVEFVPYPTWLCERSVSALRLTGAPSAPLFVGAQGLVSMRWLEMTRSSRLSSSLSCSSSRERAMPLGKPPPGECAPATSPRPFPAGPCVQAESTIQPGKERTRRGPNAKRMLRENRVAAESDMAEMQGASEHKGREGGGG